MYTLQSIIIIGIPFACYYLGIFIRKKIFPGNNSLRLSRQFLIGIPVSLLVVSPLLAAFTHLYLQEEMPSIFLCIGSFIQQGMVMNERATKMINNLLPQNRGKTPLKTA